MLYMRLEQECGGVEVWSILSSARTVHFLAWVVRNDVLHRKAWFRVRDSKAKFLLS